MASNTVNKQNGYNPTVVATDASLEVFLEPWQELGVCVEGGKERIIYPGLEEPQWWEGNVALINSNRAWCGEYDEYLVQPSNLVHQGTPGAALQLLLNSIRTWFGVRLRWCCTDSRPWARWYQLRGLPLVGSECVCPQCNSSFVITQESAKPSAFGLPVHLSKAH